MKMLQAAGIALGFFVGLICAGCDPGYQMRPVGWTPMPDGKWTKDVGGFTVQTPRITGLIGETWLYMDFEIAGNTQPIKLDSAQLRAESGVYEGKLDRRCQTVAAGDEHGRLCVAWAFDQAHTVPRVMGARSAFILNLQVGAEPRVIQIDYERADN